MRTSAAGVAAIKRFEGCRLRAYQCAAGVYTIGYGHTGPEVVRGLEWTQAQADAALVRDLERFERAVASAITRRMSPGQFDAMVSLAFNIGARAFARSTLVKRFEAGDVAGAGEQFVVWNKVGGRTHSGLLRRRAAELWMFARASA